MKFVAALNSIHSNTWAVIILFLGAGLLCSHNPAASTAGGGLVTGAFAIIRTENSSANPTQPAPKE